MRTNEDLNILFDKFENFIKSETIIGKEIKIGDVTIIPLASISFGLCSGGGNGGDNSGNNGGGSGSAIAAKATPTALLIINGDNVNIISIKKGNSFESLLESIPNLIDKLKNTTDKKNTDNFEEDSEEDSEE